MANAEAIRAALLARKNKQGNGENNTQTRSNGGDNASFPFWNMPEGTTTVVRYLPDGDPENPFFWVNREVINLPFSGVVGGDYPTTRDVTVTVPCIDMFGMQCPIIAATRLWWKDEARVSLARRYYKKRSFIFQGFVVSSSLEEKEIPENPIRRFVINKSIYDIIENSLVSPEMEDLPTDFISGRDFKISKTKKGEYANYSTSSWSMRTRSLSETEMAAIEKYGLFNLKDYLGRVPDADEIEAITAMFHDSIDGKPFDHASYGKYYRAYTGKQSDDEVSRPSTTTNTVSQQSAPVEAPAPVQAVVDEAPSAPAKMDPQDLLAKIRARQQAGK